MPKTTNETHHLFRVPPSLADESDDTCAVALLRAYYEPEAGQTRFFTGSLFDTWDTTHERSRSDNIFTPDDLLAVTTLSVSVAPLAARRLLVDDRAHFAALLHEVDPDRDLADVHKDDINRRWPLWRLEQALRALPKVGRTTASKLLARKRPRLAPITDRVVRTVTATEKQQWLPLYAALHGNPAVHPDRLLRIRDEAVGLSPVAARRCSTISPLRVLDVVAWMDGGPTRRGQALHDFAGGAAQAGAAD